MPPATFLAVEAAAATVWSSTTALEYYFFGHAIVGAPTWLQVLLVIAGLLTAFITLRLLRGRLAAAEPPERPAG
jgi:membrane protein DedA with SNARE-associated domain